MKIAAMTRAEPCCFFDKGIKAWGKAGKRLENHGLFGGFGRHPDIRFFGSRDNMTGRSHPFKRHLICILQFLARKKGGAATPEKPASSVGKDIIPPLKFLVN
jgi:hypothetical protein